MRLSQVKSQLRDRGQLDARELFSYATAVGTLNGTSFQNLMGAAFTQSQLILFSAKTDGSLGDVLLRVPYSALEQFLQKHRFLYSYTSFTCGSTSLRFYNYDKKVFLRGFSEAGIGGTV